MWRIFLFFLSIFWEGKTLRVRGQWFKGEISNSNRESYDVIPPTDQTFHKKVVKANNIYPWKRECKSHALCQSVVLRFIIIDDSSLACKFRYTLVFEKCFFGLNHFHYFLCQYKGGRLCLNGFSLCRTSCQCHHVLSGGGTKMLFLGDSILPP